MSIRGRVLSAGVWAPGLPGWAVSRGVLAGEEAYVPCPTPAPAPSILAATERRRTGPVVRLALTVAQEAAVGSGLEPGSLRSVFGSSNGDGVVVGEILEALAGARVGEKVVSPTQFHNSVHNAAAGYWSIAHGSREPATCLGAHDATWAAALLKAGAEMAASREAVLLCVYDHPLPAPLDALRPTAAAFGAAFVLAPGGDEGVGFSLRFVAERAEMEVLPGGLETIRAGNPAAQCLPLLVALARSGGTQSARALGEGGRLVFPYLDGHLVMELGG